MYSTIGRGMPKGAFLYDVRGEGGGGQEMQQICIRYFLYLVQRLFFCMSSTKKVLRTKRGEGEEKSKNYVDIINGSPLMELSPLSLLTLTPLREAACPEFSNFQFPACVQKYLLQEEATKITQIHKEIQSYTTKLSTNFSSAAVRNGHVP